MAVTPCALCLNVPADSDEHVVPKSIGGGLKLPILCTSCNSRLGHEIDEQALRSGPIQEAALVLRDTIPWLWRDIGHRVEVRSLSADIPMQVEKKTGEPQVQPHRDQESGGIWRPQTDLGRRDMRRSIRARVEEAQRIGREPQLDVEGLLDKVMAMKPGEVLDVPDLALTFVQKQDKGVEYRLGPPLPARYFARIAYLSLFAMGVDPKDAALEPWRRFISGEGGGSFSDGVNLGRLDGPAEYMAQHEVLVPEPRGSLYTVDIVLFGRLAWRAAISLKRAVEAPFFAYSMALAHGKSVYCVSREHYEQNEGHPVPAPDPRSGW